MQLVFPRHATITSTALGVGLMLLLCAVHPSTATATVTPSGVAFVGGAAATTRYEGVYIDPCVIRAVWTHELP